MVGDLNGVTMKLKCQQSVLERVVSFQAVGLLFSHKLSLKVGESLVTP